MVMTSHTLVWTDHCRFERSTSLRDETGKWNKFSRFQQRTCSRFDILTRVRSSGFWKACQFRHLYVCERQTGLFTATRTNNWTLAIIKRKFRQCTDQEGAQFVQNMLRTSLHGFRSGTGNCKNWQDRRTKWLDDKKKTAKDVRFEPLVRTGFGPKHPRPQNLLNSCCNLPKMPVLSHNIRPKWDWPKSWICARTNPKGWWLWHRTSQP